MDAEQWRCQFVAIVSKVFLETPDSFKFLSSRKLFDARKCSPGLDKVLADICCEAALSAAGKSMAEQSIRGGQ